MATHEVTNQPPPLAGYNVFTTDLALLGAVRSQGASWAEAALSKLGERAGSDEAQSLGAAANAHPPVLRTHDRYGNRIDLVEYHPAYHELMRTAVGEGLHAAPWLHPRAGAHVARAAGFFVWSQVEAGHGCPISMTYAAVPALRARPDVAAEWEPRLLSQDYDPRPLPPSEKAGALCGMAMTEKQGGSDVRGNTTTATPSGDGTYRITGHKWFCSAPMCDAFLVLAQASSGLSCFLLPRWTSAGPNGVRIQRLKDKLGNRSNASSEVEFENAIAWLVGDEGRGVPTIIEMVNHTRLDCVIGSAAGMRFGTAQAIHHATYRSAFGRILRDQPLMRNVLADLAVESEAATVTAMRLARAYDGEHESDFRRIATAVAKYFVCKRLPAHAAEALECLGGNGYVEESGMPRLFRESPLNSVWEGSGNVICLDVLRAASRSPSRLEAFFAEVSSADDVRVAHAASRLHDEIAALSDVEAAQRDARRLVERMAVLLQASLLVRSGSHAVADAFCASRLDGGGGRAFGTLPSSADLAAIIDRAAP